MAEIEQLRSTLSTLQEQPSLTPELEEELNRLREGSSELQSLQEQIQKLQAEAESASETALKLTALESEREQLVAELEKAKAESGDSAEFVAIQTEVSTLREVLANKEQEIAQLRVSLESSQEQGMEDSSIKDEIEQLTKQVADQLLAIQNFEGMLEQAKQQIETKDAELQPLIQKLLPVVVLLQLFRLKAKAKLLQALSISSMDLILSYLKTQFQNFRHCIKSY